METSSDRFIRILTRSHRVVVLGGLAVIAHGLSRSTYDGDVWLEPMDSAGEWCAVLERICDDFGGLTICRLPGWTPVTGEGLTAAMTNPSPEVQALAMEHLQEFAAAGDPFSQAILAGRELR